MDVKKLVSIQGEKKVKTAEREILSLKSKADSLSADLRESQTQCRNTSAELYRIKVKTSPCLVEFTRLLNFHQDQLMDVLDKNQQWLLVITTITILN